MNNDVRLCLSLRGCRHRRILRREAIGPFVSGWLWGLALMAALFVVVKVIGG